MLRKFLFKTAVPFSWFSWTGMNVLLIVLGILLRLKHYLANDSLWLDEAWLAMDISTRTFADIISARIFSYDLPTLPPGFVLIEKAFITLFGNNEYVLRFFPMLCGIAAIFLFYGLCKKYLIGPAVTVAMAFFVFSDILVHYSGSLKQYSSGVFTVLLLYYVMERVDSLDEMNVPRSVLYGLAGGIAIALFYPSALILAGIGTTQAVDAFLKKDGERFKGLLFSFFLWFLFFAVITLVYCYYMFNNKTLPWLTNPDPVWSIGNGIYLLKSLEEELLTKAVGWVPAWLGGCFLLIGVVSLARRKTKWGLAFGLPVLIAVLAMGARVYPMKPRFLIAFIPGLLIIFSHGAGVAMQCKKKTIAALSTIILCLLLVHPVLSLAPSATYALAREEMRPLVRYLKKHQRPHDVLVINSSAQYAYVYYLGYFQVPAPINPVLKVVDRIENGEEGPLLFLREEHYVFGPNGKYRMIDKKGALRAVAQDTVCPFGCHPRTWVLLTHVPDETRVFLLAMMDRDGVLLKKVEETGSELYLYDLSREK